MGRPTGREVARSDEVVFDKKTDDANHRIATELARRERALAIRHESEESNAVALGERHDLAGRLAVRMGRSAKDTVRRLAESAETDEDMGPLRLLAESYLKVTNEAYVAHAKRILE